VEARKAEDAGDDAAGGLGAAVAAGQRGRVGAIDFCCPDLIVEGVEQRCEEAEGVDETHRGREADAGGVDGGEGCDAGGERAG